VRGSQPRRRQETYHLLPIVSERTDAQVKDGRILIGGLGLFLLAAGLIWESNPSAALAGAILLAASLLSLLSDPSDA
jgi:hypothetical protein